MSEIQAESYAAFIDAGASEDKAHAAAVALAGREELASKAELQNAFSEVKIEIARVDKDLATGFAKTDAALAKLRGDMETGFAKTDAGFATLRGDMETGIVTLRGDMEKGFARNRAEMHSDLWKMVGGLVAIFGLFLALATFLT